jgi:SAM-dependent methyltransferase
MLNSERQDALRKTYQQENPSYRTSRQIYEELLAAHIDSTSVVLDAGCGQAGIVEQVVPHVRSAVGIDRTFVDFRHTIKLRDLVQGTLETLPFSSCLFDVISCTWVLEHLRQPDRVFNEFARVLRVGGVLLLLAPNAHNYVTIMNRLVPGWLHKSITHCFYGRDQSFTFPVYYGANTKGKLESNLAPLGFGCEFFEYVGDPTYIAFNRPLYCLGKALERLTDGKRGRRFKVHFVAAYRYQGYAGG